MALGGKLVWAVAFGFWGWARVQTGDMGNTSDRGHR
jgi:hypothetical protein